MFSSKKPKFSLDLTVNELSNIPQVSGYCFLELSIKDSKRLRLFPLKGHAPADDDKLILKSLDVSQLTSSSGNVTVTTSRKKIHNFKCSFNYNLTCNLRFPYKRRENLIADKFLSVRVFYVNDAKHHTTELGRLDVNLLEYLNFTNPKSSKYLLRESKVNSILSLTVFLKELPSNYDFHTQLQIHDSHSTHESEKKRSTSTTKFNVPQFERSKVFGGLNDVIHLPNDLASFTHSASPTSLHFSSDELEVLRPKPDEASNVIMDPIISNLYKKILESTWDPELHTLLAYPPEKCIEDIFASPSPQAYRELLAKKFGGWRDEDDGDVREINGLINEVKFRDDLRSWLVN